MGDIEQSWDNYDDDGNLLRQAEVPETLQVSYDFKTGQFSVPVEDLSTVVQYCLGNLTKRDARFEAVKDFLGTDEFDSHHRDFTGHMIDANIKCFHDVLYRDFEVTKVTNFNRNFDGSDKECAPKYREFRVAPGEKESLLAEGFIFAEHKQFGSRMVFELEAYLEGGEGYLEFRTHYCRQDEIVHSFWEAVRSYFCSNASPLKNQIINNKWEYVAPSDVSLSDVVLSDDSRTLLQRNVLSFLRNSADFAERGLSRSRGLLLYGRPGTGKTMTCEAIINQVDCTVIVVSNDTVDNVREIKEIYELAEKLAPSLMVIEDIDTLGGLDRRDGHNHPLLGELLASLNGVGATGNVVTVATTNYPEHLDRALADRPGRFDIRVEFPMPNLDLRRAILSKYLKQFETKGIKMDRLARETEGLTGAYLREVVTNAYLMALETDAGVITDAIITEALGQVVGMRDTALQEIGVTTSPSNDMFS